MEELSQQELIEFEKNLVKKIKLLKGKIQKLPAYIRRKKDEKNRQNFFTYLFFIILSSIAIFVSEWLAVAVSEGISLIIAGPGLFLSIAIGFSGKILYNACLWIRDLFSSEKIKNQNKEFNQINKQILELEKLAAKISRLIAKINYQLNNALQWLPSKLLNEKSTEFKQVSLKKYIQRLNQKKENLPAYARKEKDEFISDEINEYWKNYMFVLIFIKGLFIFIILMYPPIALLIPFTTVLLFIPVVFIVAFGPIIMSNIMRVTYLCMRDLFSSVDIKAENKQLAQLEKVIAKLLDLENQLQQITSVILSKLEQVEVAMQTIVVSKEKESFYKASNNNFAKTKSFKYGPMFSEIPDNQTLNNALSVTPILTS